MASSRSSYTGVNLFDLVRACRRLRTPRHVWPQDRVLAYAPLRFVSSLSVASGMSRTAYPLIPAWPMRLRRVWPPKLPANYDGTIRLGLILGAVSS